MRSRERLLSAIKGKPVDRVPWSPFLVYFWESQPREIRDIGQFTYMKREGFDPLMRGFHTLFTVERNRCTTTVTTAGNMTYTRYDTPVGSLTMEQTYSPQGNTVFVTKHAVETREDFKILTYMNENAKLVPNLQEFEQDSRRVGEDGLYIPLIGSEGKTCFQMLVEHWVGTEQLAYALNDDPDVVRECLSAMQQRSMESAKICVDSSSEVFLFWEDSSTTNISPRMFIEYAAPEIRQWAEILHTNGRFLVHHACGHIRDLLEPMIDTGIDMIDSLSEPPTGNITVAEAVKILPDHIGIIGGIEPTIFLNSSLEELEVYVRRLLDATKGKRFILGNSDSCPPGLTLEKFRLVNRIVRGEI